MPLDDLLPGLRVTGFERRVTIAFVVTEAAVLIEGIFYGGRDFETAFRNREFIAYLQTAFRAGKLGFHGELKSLGEKRSFAQWLKRLTATEWVVYAKPPFGGPQQVLKYLARYTHRVAISDQRLVSLEDGRVTFRWKNYARAGEPATMTLRAEEFIRRFLLHVFLVASSRSAISAFWPTAADGTTSACAANCWGRAQPHRRASPRTTCSRTNQQPTRPSAVRAVSSGV